MAIDLPGLTPILQQQLKKWDLEDVHIVRPNSDGSLEVAAKKLHPTAIDKQEPVYIPVPVSLQVRLDDKNTVTDVGGITPSAEQIEAAEYQAKGLVDNGQLGGGNFKSVANPTHQIVTNEKGQKVIRRMHT